MIDYKQKGIRSCRQNSLLLSSCFVVFCLIYFVSPLFAQTSVAKDSQVVKDNSLSLSNKAKPDPSNTGISAYFPQSQQQRQKTFGFADFLSSFFFLVIIIALILFLAWILKRTGLTPGAGNQIIKVLSTVAIGQKEKLAIIEVGSQQVLIGVTPGNIQKLMVLESAIKVDDHPPATVASFSTQLLDRLKIKNAN